MPSLGSGCSTEPGLFSFCRTDSTDTGYDVRLPSEGRIGETRIGTNDGRKRESREKKEEEVMIGLCLSVCLVGR